MSLLPNSEVSQTTVDAYADLLETEYFFMFPTDYTEASRVIPKQVIPMFLNFVLLPFFRCFQINEKIWLLLPILDQRHWSLLAVHMIKQRIYIFNSLEKIHLPTNLIKYVPFLKNIKTILRYLLF